MAQPEPSHVPGAPPPTGRARARVNGFIVAFLAVQVLAPLSYYTLRQDRLDERFAWRMFSEVRMVRCEARFAVAGSAVALSARYHSAWITLLERGRRDVVRGVALDLCADHPGQPVTLDLACTFPDRTTLTVFDGEANLCANPP